MKLETDLRECPSMSGYLANAELRAREKARRAERKPEEDMRTTPSPAPFDPAVMFVHWRWAPMASGTCISDSKAATIPLGLTAANRMLRDCTEAEAEPYYGVLFCNRSNPQGASLFFLSLAACETFKAKAASCGSDGDAPRSKRETCLTKTLKAMGLKWTAAH